jgi:hypothetical protein
MAFHSFAVTYCKPWAFDFYFLKDGQNPQSILILDLFRFTQNFTSTCLKSGHNYCTCMVYVRVIVSFHLSKPGKYIWPLKIISSLKNDQKFFYIDLRLPSSHESTSMCKTAVGGL